MNRYVCFAAMTLVAGMLAAQDQRPPSPNSNSQAAPQAHPQTQMPRQTETPQTTSPSQSQSGPSSTSSTSSSSGTASMPEMKTQTYKGTLVDAACAGGGSGSSASAASSSSTTTAAGTSTSVAADTSKPASADRSKDKKGEASRSASDASACSVSSSTSRFALKMKDGQTVQFDAVGNERAQIAIKEKKKWTESASSGKAIQAKVSGVLNGDKLTVVSIN